MEATLFKDEPEPAVAISFEGYAVAFDGADLLREVLPDLKPDWQIDTETICETQEAAASLMEEFASGAWKIVKVKIVAEELSPQTN